MCVQIRAVGGERENNFVGGVIVVSTGEYIKRAKYIWVGWGVTFYCRGKDTKRWGEILPFQGVVEALRREIKKM